MDECVCPDKIILLRAILHMTRNTKGNKLYTYIMLLLYNVHIVVIIIIVCYY